MYNTNVMRAYSPNRQPRAPTKTKRTADKPPNCLYKNNKSGE